MQAIVNTLSNENFRMKGKWVKRMGDAGHFDDDHRAGQE
jgi:hypothetical protein